MHTKPTTGYHDAKLAPLVEVQRIIGIAGRHRNPSYLILCRDKEHVARCAILYLSLVKAVDLLKLRRHGFMLGVHDSVSSGVMFRDPETR